MVDVLLELVEYVLHAAAYLQAVVLVQVDVVCQTDTHLKERGCLHFLILRDITCQVWHEHRARQFAVERNRKVAHGFDIKEQVGVVVRRAQHTVLCGHKGTPLLGYGITALLVGVTNG